jgi:hypothetical protein
MPGSNPEVPLTVFRQPIGVLEANAIGLTVAMKPMILRLADCSFTGSQTVTGDPDVPCMIFDDGVDTPSIPRL